MVLFGSLLHHFVSGFVRVNVLSTFKFDAVRFMNSSTGFFDRWTKGLGQLFCLLS